MKRRILAAFMALSIVWSILSSSIASYATDVTQGSESAETSITEPEQEAAPEEEPGEKSGHQQEEKPAEQEESGHQQEEKPAEQEESGHQQEEKPAGQEESGHQEEKSAGQEESAHEQEQTPVQQEETDSQQPAPNQTQPGERTLETAWRSADGTVYTLKVTFDQTAEIPENAVLSAVEYVLKPEDMKAPENKDRPYDTERFITQGQLEDQIQLLTEGLEVEEEDYIFFTKLLQITLTADGKAIQPKAPVEVYIETNAVDITASDGVEAAVYDRKEKEYLPISVENHSDDPLPKKERKQKENYTRLTFVTDRFDTMALVGVAGELYTWTAEEMEISVLGSRYLDTQLVDAKVKAPEAGVELVDSFAAEVKRDEPDHDVTFWVSAKPAEDQAQLRGITDNYVLENRDSGEQLNTKTEDGTSVPAQILEGEKIALLRDTGFRNLNMELDNVTLEGMMPQGATAAAVDVSAQFDDLEKVADQAKNLSKAAATDRETLVAYDISIQHEHEEYQPEQDKPVTVTVTHPKINEHKKLEIWHVLDDGRVEVIRDFSVEGHSISFQATGFSEYAILENTITGTLSIQNTVYGSDEEKNATYTIELSSDVMNNGDVCTVDIYSKVGDYTYGQRDFTVNEGKLRIEIENGSELINMKLPEGTYTLSQILPDGYDYMTTTVELNGEEAQTLPVEGITVAPDQVASAKITNTHYVTVTNHLTEGEQSHVQVKYGDPFSFTSTDIIDGYVYDRTTVLTEGVTFENGVLTIDRVTCDCDIYGVFDTQQPEDDYTFLVAVDEQWCEMNRTRFTPVLHERDREAFFNRYLHDVYVKFYHEAYQSSLEYAFGHNAGNTDKSWNQKSQNGMTRFFLQNNNSLPHYLLYTPSAASAEGKDEISIVVKSGTDDLKKNSFYTITLSDELKAAFGDSVDGVLTGVDVAGDFPLKSIDRNDFVSDVEILEPNLFGFSGRQVKVTVKVPNSMINDEGKVTHKFFLTDGSGEKQLGVYNAAEKSYSFDLPALTKPMKVVVEMIPPGHIFYQYADPEKNQDNADDDFSHVIGLDQDSFNQEEDWVAGYKTRPASSFTSYTATHKSVYTFNSWVDLETGAEYPADAEIETKPGSYLRLAPKWECKTTPREVRVEYYNTYWDAVEPIHTVNYFFTDADSYEVQSPYESLYYVETTGQRYQFLDWRTESGQAVNTGDRLDLKDFQYFDNGEYEVLRLTADWKPAVDPWSIGYETYGSFAIVSDRFATSGYSASSRYYALQNNSGNSAGTVDYDSGDQSITLRETTIERWNFIPQEDGTYVIKSGTRTDKYLNVEKGRLQVSNSPQHIEVLYSVKTQRYVFRTWNGTESILLGYGNPFNTVTRSFTDAEKNDDNGRNARFLLAKVNGAVAYRYPKVAAVFLYPEEMMERPNDITKITMPKYVYEKWEEGYTIKAPSQNSVQLEEGDVTWKYTFDHWQVNSSNPEVVYHESDPIDTEPFPLVLNAVWKFEKIVPTAIQVKYKVVKFSEANNNDEMLPAGTDLPAVSGLTMTGVNSVNNASRYRTATETVTDEAISAYRMRRLDEDYYITRNGKKYEFVGWRIKDTEADEEVVLTTLDDLIDLTEYDTNRDKAVELTSVWRIAVDPWGLDGMEYMIVCDSLHLAMGTTEYTNGGNVGLKKYDLIQPDSTIPVYEPKNPSVPVVFWHLKAQADGTYTLSTVVDGVTKYLKMTGAQSNNSAGALRLTDNESEASGLYFFRFSGEHYDRYMICRNIGTSYTKSMMDYFNNTHAIFSIWGKDAPADNNKLTLGLPKEGTVIYHYEKYDGIYPEGKADTGTENNLPHVTTKFRQTIVDTPSQNTYSSSGGFYQWNYQFAGWKEENGTFHNPGDTISVSGRILDLYAVWKPANEFMTPVSKTIRYVMNYPKLPESEPNFDKNTVTNKQEVASGEGLKDFRISGFDSAYFRALEKDPNGGKNIYAFTGWKTESETLIQPSTINGNLNEKNAIFDTDRDGIITLEAQWSYTYANDSSRSREVKFYVSVVAISADAFNDEVAISTQGGDFTNAVHYTLMEPADAKAPKLARDEGLKQNDVYALVGYDDEKKVPVASNDEVIRRLQTTGIAGTDGTNNITYTTLSFPTDEEVLNYLKEELKTSPGKVKLDGVPVDPADLTTDNFTIRWYVCKAMSGNNGWHIDGKLTPNLSYLTIQKQFTGDEEALKNIPKNFTITIKDSRQTAGSISSSNRFMANLTLTDKTSREDLKTYGLYSGTATNGTFGYVNLDKDTNTYTWLIPVARGKRYEISEENYAITDGTVSYGISAQYSIINAQSGEETPRTPWFGTVQGYSATYPRTAVNVYDTSSMQIQKLYNTYIETGTFIVQKIDVGLDGKGDHPMPNVAFKVYKQRTDGSFEILRMMRRPNSKPGRYTELHGQGVPVDTVYTGSDGMLYLSLPKPQADNSEFIYKIEEVVPDGYRSGETKPSLMVHVNNLGSFTINESDFVQPEGSTIKKIEAAYNDGSMTSNLVAGVTITNMPKPLNITATKIWDSHHRQGSVTFRLKGQANGVTTLVKDFILTEENAVKREDGTADLNEWLYSLNQQFPMMVGNVKVDYTLEERQIGSYTVGSPIFNNWEQVNQDFYRNSAGESVENYRNSFDYTSIDMQIINEDRSDKYISTDVYKTDDSTPAKYLPGIDFKVFRQRNGSQQFIKYRGEDIPVVVENMLTTKNGPERRLLDFGKIYYFLEDPKTEPTGYVSKEGKMFRIQVDDNGNVTIDAEAPWTADDIKFEQRNNSIYEGKLTIKNTLAAQEVKFQKTDGFGKALGGADFALYQNMNDAKNKTNSQQILVNEKEVTSVTSAKNGEVVFKVPKGVYYMAEKAPDGYKGEDIWLLLVGAENWSSLTGVLKDIKASDLSAQTGTGPDQKDYVIFRLDDNGIAMASTDIASFGILNESNVERRVILEKVTKEHDGSYQSRKDAQFKIYRSDFTPVESTDSDGNKTNTFTSGENGVYFVDKLPLGIYYLEETQAPSGYESNQGKWFYLIVTESKVKVSEQNYATRDAARTALQSIENELIP